MTDPSRRGRWVAIVTGAISIAIAVAYLALITVPTLLIAGENDPNASPDVMRKMGERILGSRLHVMEGIGHLMNLEAPDDFDQLLIEFLRDNPAHVRH